MRSVRRVVLAGSLFFTAVVGGACGTGDGWRMVGVERAGFAEDRSIVWAQTTEYHSYSCYDVRLDLDRDQNPWRVGVRVKSTSDMCTMEAEIGDPPESATDVVVAPGADDDHSAVGHNLVELDLGETAPSGVTLAID